MDETKKTGTKAKAEPVSAPEPDEKKYSLRGAMLAIERRKAAVAKRKEKILTLRAENSEDLRMIRRLEALCDALRLDEIRQRVGQYCGSGNAMTSANINKLLDFCELVGDALSEVSAEQLAGLFTASSGQVQEIAEEAKKQYDENTETEKAEL